MSMFTAMMLYPLAWVRVRLPERPIPTWKAWNTAKFRADAARRDKRFREKYGDMDGFMSTLVHAEDDAQ